MKFQPNILLDLCRPSIDKKFSENSMIWVTELRFMYDVLQNSPRLPPSIKPHEVKFTRFLEAFEVCYGKNMLTKKSKWVGDMLIDYYVLRN